MNDKTSDAVSVKTRRLAAIMFTDIVGFSRQMGANESRAMRLLALHNQVIEQTVAEHHGHVIKTAGDGFLVEFASVVHAVQCAQRIQAQFHAYNAEKARDEQIHIRIGLHEGDIIVQPNGDLLGDGVNIASRLQTFTAPDTICLSQKIYEEVEKKLPLGPVVSLGQPKLKNIAQRFQVYALLPEKPVGFHQQLQVQQLKLKQWRRPLQVAALLVLLASAGLIGRYFYVPTPAGLPLPDKPSIVILPFANLSNDPEQEYFSDGLTEDLTSALSKLSGLFVISRNTASTYKGKPVKVQEVGKELGVQYVLEGSVRKAEGQVRITAQLIDALQDHHLWTERYDRPLKDIFVLQDEIVQKIVTTLKLQLTLWEQGYVVRKTTENLEAYDFYLRGVAAYSRALYETEKEANIQARQMFEKAIELDPQYAEAYGWLGATYWLEWFQRWSPDPTQSLERSLELAQQVIALDDSLAGPHRVLSSIYVRKRQHEQAIAEAQRAVALDPNNPDSYVNLAESLRFAGRSEEAIGLVEKAMRLNPQYPTWYLTSLGMNYRAAGRYEEAVAPLKKAATLNPNFWVARANLAACYAELGRLEEARSEVMEFQRLAPNFSLEVLRQVLPYKDPAEVERFFASLRKAGMK